MDSLTQIVLGAATAELIAGKKLGNRALLYGAILGTVPDLDVFIGNFYDIVTSNEIHRGFSHSILFFLIATPPLGYLIKWIERKNALTSREAFLMVFWCLFTHAILDAFTNWGTQIFWPLEKRIAFQSIFVIDPLYTLPFIYCLVRVMRLKRTDSRRYKWNLQGIYISSAYLLLTVGLQQFAKMKFEDALQSNEIKYDKISVRPAPLTSILWNANAQFGDRYYLMEYSFFDSKPISYIYFDRHEELLEQWTDDPLITRLVKMSEGWYVITKQDGNLYFNDLRFGLMNDDPQNPEFVFRYILAVENGKLVGKESESPSREQPGKLLRRLWNRIKGN